MTFPAYFFTLLRHSFASAFREHFLCARHRARLSKCIILCCPHNNPAPILPVITPCCPSPNTNCTSLPLSFCPCCSHSWQAPPSTLPATKILHGHSCHAHVRSLLGSLPQPRRWTKLVLCFRLCSTGRALPQASCVGMVLPFPAAVTEGPDCPFAPV